MMAMEPEITLGDIYEEIADRLAQARTKALMGEREEALGLMQAASLEYTRFRETLKDFPGHRALEYAFNVTMTQLCAEHEQVEEPAAIQPTARAKSRRKAVRAA